MRSLRWSIAKRDEINKSGSHEVWGLLYFWNGKDMELNWGLIHDYVGLGTARWDRTAYEKVGP